MTWYSDDPHQHQHLAGLIAYAHANPNAKLGLVVYCYDREVHRQALNILHKVKIGHAHECDIRLQDDGLLASWHLTVRKDERGWLCEDHYAESGSYINGRRFYDRVALRPWDEINMGTYTIQVIDQSLEWRPCRFQLKQPKPLYVGIFSKRKMIDKFSFTQDDLITIGRSQECAITLPNTKVSRFHVDLFCEDGTWTIKDRGSMNGTVLNEETIPTKETRVLENGDRLLLGDLELLLSFTPIAQYDRPITEPLPDMDRQTSQPFAIKIVDPDKTSRIYRSHKPIIKIGRSGDADILIQDGYISRQHARFTMRRDQLFIEQERDSARIYINGKQLIHAQAVYSGDHIYIGSYNLIYLNPSAYEWKIYPMTDILVQSPSGSWTRHKFIKDKITIGRMPQCDLTFNSSRVSRLHAWIEVMEDHYILRDNDSTNGVEINGQIIHGERLITPQDTLVVGHHTLRLDRRGSYQPNALNDNDETPI